MPNPGTAKAPPTWHGDEDDLSEFLDRFEALADDAGLSDDDKIKYFQKYTAKKQRPLFDALDGAHPADWALFSQSIRELFPKAFEPQTYSRGRMEKIAAQAARHEISSQDELDKFYRKFLPVSQWLLNNKRISSTERDAAFWYGFHPRTQMVLTQQLRIAYPKHDRADPYPMKQVYTVARYIFDRHAFDLNHLSDDSSEDENSHTMVDSDSDNDRWIPPKKVKPHKAAKTGKQQEVTTTIESLPVIANRNDAAEIGELIKRLTALKTTEPDYAIAYARLIIALPPLAATFPSPAVYSAGAGSSVGAGSSLPSGHGAPLSLAHSFPSAPAYAYRASNSFPGEPAARTCGFCRRPGCWTKSCPIGAQYAQVGKILLHDSWWRWPNGGRIDTHPNGLQFVIDKFYTENPHMLPSPPSGASVPNTSQPALFCSVLPSLFHPPSAVSGGPEANPVDAALGAPPWEMPAFQDDSTPLLEDATVFVTTRSGHSTSLPANPMPTMLPGRAPPQYAFKSKIEDPATIDAAFQAILATPVTLSLQQLLSASPIFRKSLVSDCKTTRSDVSLLASEDSHAPIGPSQPKTAPICVPVGLTRKICPISLPLCEVDVVVCGRSIAALLVSGSSIVGIHEELARSLGLAYDTTSRLVMQDANGGDASTLGLCRDLPIRVGTFTYHVQAHIVNPAPYQILLGRPFEFVSGLETVGQTDSLRIHNPAAHNASEVLPTRHYAPSAPAANVHSLHARLPQTSLSFSLASSLSTSSPLYFFPESAPVLTYKKVARKVHPVPTTMPAHARVQRHFPVSPLDTLAPLSPLPPPIHGFGRRLTQERWEALQVGADGCLWEEEIRLVFDILMRKERALAWCEAEKGRFKEEYFPPVIIPTVEHEPWAQRNFPIPPGLFDQVVEIIRDKIASGAYEPSTSSYCSRWFCVSKKNGKLRPVHDLQPLNAVTVKDASLPPGVEQFTERCGGRVIYTLADIFVGYDHRPLAEESRDLTTFQTPLGPHRLTVLPMGWTNSVPIFQADMEFILQDEPEARPFIDDIITLGPSTTYPDEDGHPELLRENPGIRRFVWEHLLDVYRVLHRFEFAGVTISGPKLHIGVPDVLVAGIRCNVNGRSPDTDKVKKVLTWPECESVGEVRGFLGTCGTVRIFVDRFAEIAKPLTDLTRKHVEFTWSEAARHAMYQLKQEIQDLPSLTSIDYWCGRLVILSVDSSPTGVGWIISQFNAKGDRCPSRFGSICWNEREAKYSQSKMELYGLFRALRASRLYLVGLPTFQVEVDAKYIAGMLGNPDIQPNAAINRWIAAIKLFDFTLIHVPGRNHIGPDGLSRRRQANDDTEDEQEQQEAAEQWIDDALDMGVWVSTWIHKEVDAWSQIGQGSTALKTRDVLSLLTGAVNYDSPTARVTDYISVASCSFSFLHSARLLSNPSHPRTLSATAAATPQGLSEEFNGCDGKRAVARYQVPIHSDVPPLPALLVFSLSVPDLAATASIPRSDADIAMDRHLIEVRAFLTGQISRDGLPSATLARTLQTARRFLVINGRLWRRQSSGQHQLVIPEPKRADILRQAHDGLGHKGFYSTRRQISDRFWWPGLDRDVAWFVKTCHPCQLRSMQHILIPPTVPTPANLFAKLFLDSMVMPVAQGYRFLCQGRCSLSGYAEWAMWRKETASAVGKFVFTQVLCRWGAVSEIVTDNGAPIVAGLDWLAKKYRITHIKISPYNKRANGIVERSHLTIRESLVKACGDDISLWPELVPHIFWADRVTIRKATGLSPFFIAHGIEPVLPFDLAEATYLVPKIEEPLSDAELLAVRCRQLQKREEDLDRVAKKVSAARYQSRAQFERDNAARIKDFAFKPGSLVLVRNSSIETSHSRKTKPRYFGPMVVLRHTRNNAYVLAELNGAVSKLPYAGFRLLPYYARSPTNISVTTLVQPSDMPSDDDLFVFDSHPASLDDE